MEIDEFSIVGTKGRVVADPLNGKDLFIDVGSGRRVEHWPTPDNLHAPLVTDFVNAIRDNREPRVSGEEGLRVNEVIETAYQSQTTNSIG